MYRTFTNAAVIALAAVAAGVAVPSTANAALIVTSSRTGTNINGFDEITFKLTGYTGADATFAGTNRLTSIQGTFTAEGSAATLSIPGSAATFKAGTTNSDGTTGENPPKSYLNFDTIISGDVVRTPSTTTPASLAGTWYTTTPELYLRPVDTTVSATDDEFNQTLLAQFYVTSCANVSFTGLYNTDAVQGAGVSFTSVPEPASLALAPMAAAGLLAHRRRRRHQ